MDESVISCERNGDDLWQGVKKWKENGGKRGKLGLGFLRYREKGEG